MTTQGPDASGSVSLEEGEHDIMDPSVKARRLGTGNFDRTARFTGIPDAAALTEFTKRLGRDATPAQKKGQGYKYLIGIPSLKGWLLRVRHYIRGAYYRCLQYQGYCPMCVSETLNNKEKTPSDAYINNVMAFDVKSDGSGLPTSLNPLAWKPAFTIIGGKKIERIRDIITMFDGNAAGLALQTNLTNPDFGDWDVSVWPDRSGVSKAFIQQLCDNDADGLRWKPEIFQHIEENGLPKKLWPTFLCKEITAVQAIQQFSLEDQHEWLERNKPDKSTHAAESSSRQLPASNGKPEQKVVDAEFEEISGDQAQEPGDDAARSAITSVLDEL